MSDFAKWFAQQTKENGNNKLFRNRKGMELAWNEAQKQQRQMCAEDAREYIGWWLENQHLPLNIVSACLNATG